MKILHIIRSQPDTAVRQLIDSVSQERGATEVPLFANESVDYTWLVNEIFDAERVYCWW